MCLIIWVELDVGWCSLWSGPEWGSLLINMVFWENAKQVEDDMMIVIIEAFLSQSDAVIETSLLLHLDEVNNSLQSGNHGGRGGVVLELEHEDLGVIKVRNKISGGVNEKLVEFISTPFDAMLDLIWEVSKGAHWNSFLWWILRITIALGLVWDDHLRVSFGSKGSRLKKRLLVPNASLIDVKSSMDVIDGVNNKVELLPEIIVENILGFWTDSGHVIFNVQIFIHSFSDLSGALRFGVSNVGLSEEELSV